MNNNKLISELINLLNSSKMPVISDIKKLTFNKSNRSNRQLLDVIIGLKMKQATFVIVSNNTIKVKYGNVSAIIKILATINNKFIDKLIIKPITPNVRNINNFYEALRPLYSVSGGILIEKNVKSCVGKWDTKLAVSSLVKLLIADCVYKCIKKNKITLNSVIEIKREDISVLSPGISEVNIGQYISVKELLSRMLLASDNTAMDLCIKVVGKKFFECYIKRTHKFLNIIPIKKNYINAWGSKNLSTHEIGKSVILDVAWTKGFDYFIPLNLLTEIAINLQQYWLPYDDLPNNGKLIYKGGSSPGGLSALWLCRTKKKGKVDLFTFAVNRKTPYTLVEELYTYECARKLLIAKNIIE